MKNSILILLVIPILIFQSCSKDPEPNKEQVLVDDVVAPTINFSISGIDESSSNQPIVVSDQIEISIDAKDASGIQKVEAFINATKVGEDTTEPYEIIIDLSGYSSTSGKSRLDENAVLKVVATDTNGNEAEIEQNIIIETGIPLITINFPTDYFDPQKARIYVFASAVDGKLLDVKRVFQDTEQIILKTTEEFGSDDEFSLTFGEYITGSYGNNTELTTLQNLKPSSLAVLNLKTYPRFESGSISPSSFPIAGFDPDDVFNSTAYGFMYSGGINFQEQEFNIDRRTSIPSNLGTDSIYFWLKNETLNEYSYAILDWDLPVDFTLDQSLMTQDGVEQRFFQTSFGSGDYVTSMTILGYFSDNDFENNIFHYISNSSYGFLPTQGAPYFFNNTIHKTRYEFAMKDYFTAGNGEPLETYQDLDWTLDFSQNGREIDIEKTGTGHILGKLTLGTENPTMIDGFNVSYGWNLIFNSESTDKIILPELPEDLKSWGFNSFYEGNDLHIWQAEIKRYEGLSNYNDYLDKVIKNNEHFYNVSPNVESRFKRSDPSLEGYYFKFSSFLID